MRSSRSTPASEFPVRVVGAGVLLQAARDGDYESAKKSLKASLFKKSEDVNGRDDRECTALHYAAKISNIPITKLLLDKGGDLQAEDKHGWSVLHYAVRYGNEAVVEYIIHSGADIHSKEKRGWNVLHIAARNGQAEKARVLLENGVDVHEYQSQGWNALHLAVRYGQPDTISTLLEYGINIDADNGGWTALHLAALNGHVDIVSILLNKGANSAILNRDGKTALDIAREEEHERIAAIIIETEFQGNNPDLPSPPPTPPSAPPLEFFGASSASTNSADTFDQWKIKLQQDLENISNDDSESEKTSIITGDGGESKDVRYSWKSFEEEKMELLQQLEKVRLKEVTRISEEIQKKQEKHQVSMVRMEKQKHLLHARIENMRANIPNTKESGKIKYQTLKEDITQISSLIENSAAETDVIENLRSLQIETDFCEITRQKKEILEQLAQVQLLEREELEAIKREKYNEIDMCEANSEREVGKITKRIRILEEELDLLITEKNKKEKKHVETIVRLKEELVKAERQRVIAQKEEDEDQFACPVCLELLKPPLRIFQCPEGHILCENCKENPALVHCPQCRVPLERNCSRNRALEEVARNYFPSKIQTKL